MKKNLAFLSILLISFSSKAVTVSVQSDNLFFSPNAVTINVGDIVAFSNIAGFHSVEWLTAPTTLPSNTAFLGAFPVNFTLSIPGVYTYRCGVHTTSMFGSITVQDAVLPIQLKLFDIKRKEENFELKWMTLNESQVSHFELERAVNGLNFKSVTKINAKGTKQEETTYSFIDIAIPSQSEFVYYRLKTVDLNQKFEYSPIIFAKVKSEMAFTLYPNPSTNFIIIEGGGHDFHHTTNQISVFSKIGQRLIGPLEMNLQNGGMFDIDVSRLGGGQFFALIENKLGAKKTIKFEVNH